jgi:phenylacetate-coenzyme A ligase PaaK-like adenylate-forming protein
MGDARFFDDIKATAWEAVRRVELEKLKAQLRYVAAHSGFYQRKFAAAGSAAGADRPARGCRHPALRREGGAAREPAAGAAARPASGRPLERVAQIQAPSGTTGGPAYVGLTRRDQFVWQEMGARCPYASGIRPGDLVLHGFSVSRRFVGLVDPDHGEVLPWKEGVAGEPVYTALERECSPLVHFRTRDHAVVTGLRRTCGRTAPMIRVVGHTDDLLIVKGINVFPGAVRGDGAAGHLRQAGHPEDRADRARQLTTP